MMTWSECISWSFEAHDVSNHRPILCNHCNSGMKSEMTACRSIIAVDSGMQYLELINYWIKKGVEIFWFLWSWYNHTGHYILNFVSSIWWKIKIDEYHWCYLKVALIRHLHTINRKLKSNIMGILKEFQLVSVKLVVEISIKEITHGAVG